MIKVAKFGGTSMANASSFALVAETVLCDKEIAAVVVSAGGRLDDLPKVTDALIAAYGDIRGGKGAKKSLDAVFERVRRLVRDLKLNFDIEDELRKIETSAEVAVSPDFLLSRGEYLYSKIFAKYSCLPFVDAARLFKFDRDGRLNAEFSYYSIRRVAAKVGKFVTGGFYGSNESGDIGLLPRGGGDMSGAIVARALSADEYLNYTDVDGVYPYDPRVIVGLNPIRTLPYGLVRRLGEFGASVLQTDCVLPLSDKGIPITVKNTFNPSGEGTTICLCSGGETPFVAAAIDDRAVVVAKSVGRAYDVLSKISKGTRVYSSIVTADTCECVVSKYDFTLSTDCSLSVISGVTLFFISKSAASERLISKIAGDEKVLYVDKFSGGWYVAVRGEYKSFVEKAIENVLCEINFI